MQNQNRILVVGGTGFIGHHIVQRALSLGWNVTCLSLNKNNTPLKGVSYLRADVGDVKSLKDCLDRQAFEYVVNCGGYINHTSFFSGGSSVLDAHFKGMVNIISSIDIGVLKHFINIGSSDEYGSVSAPQSECIREVPISPYSMAKTACTHFLQMLYKTEGIPSTTLRLFLTYGPGQDDKRFLPQIIRGCLADSVFPVSYGGQLRDFCFISDTVDAVFLTMLSDGAKGEVINIASGQPVSIRNVIETVRDIIGKGKPKFGEIDYRPGENMELYADISKANSLLNWQPQISLREGIKMTIQWVECNS